MSHLRIFLKFPSLASTRSRRTGVHATYETALYAARFLPSICILMRSFQALVWTRTNTHVIHADTLLLVVYIYVNCRIGIVRYIA